MKTSNLTKIERAAAVAAVNRYGSGQHPEANDETLSYFRAAYIAECLTKALPHLGPEYVGAARNAIAKLS